MNEMAKLQVLLGHWIEHNQEHGEEFVRWAQRARAAGLEEVARPIAEAARSAGEATRCLRQALARLETGGGSDVSK
ncbi:MAG: hypothetical protein HYW07_08045 [Candidatus Latescibacteria bacterium]|nr:hypothetical protein [Candidatus Latescibacterota bacterium]